MRGRKTGSLRAFGFLLCKNKIMEKLRIKNCKMKQFQLKLIGIKDATEFEEKDSRLL